MHKPTNNNTPRNSNVCDNLPAHTTDADAFAGELCNLLTIRLRT